MPEYIKVLHQTDGPTLLSLTKADFTVPPLSRMSPDGGERLLERIEILQMETHIEDHKNGHANGHIGGIPNGTSKLQRNGTLGRKDFETKIRIPIPTVEPPRSSFPTEWGKTGIAFIYAIICFVTTTVVISVVHERVPPKEHTPPLPDKFFDLFDRREWAFSICEINGMLLVGLWLIQWILLKHRYGPLCCIQACPSCIYTRHGPLLGNWEAQMRRIMKMIAGGGLSITGSHTMCGDYLYSGHTVMLTLTFLFIKECKLLYSPRRFWYYHWFCLALSAFGIFCILLAHDHYTVDVVVAYFITTRLFWWYHTMANQQTLPVFRRERERYGSPELPAASFSASVSLEPCQTVQPTGHPVTPVELKQARTVT
ncbi:sphingomyelin synthase [Xenoophorus captivus]|uniref:Sphingomyelin synthase n=1 Tax=Xenoophorus captivus TaxID=1517983 RepID=A0ABV0REL9_9TELE